MRNTIWIAICSFLFLVACKKEGVNPTNCRSGKCTYEMFENSQLAVTLGTFPGEGFVDIESGDHRVFQYSYEANDNPRISDDEYWEDIYFEIPSDVEEFEYRDAEMLDQNLVFQPSCFCLIETVLITKGSIKGKRLSDNRWEIEMDIAFEWGESEEDRKFKADFELVQ